jgi:SAM-dependent methyltransferase
MSMGRALGSVVKRLDRQLGIRAWLGDEPRPPAGGFDLNGEKLIDWGWICATLPREPKRALEIGSGKSPIVPAMLALGYDVTAVDLCEDLSRQVAGFRLLLGDFNALEIEHGFDVVVLCSVVEHIGLSGRYGSPEDEWGDVKAMRKIASLLNPDGLLFLTIPVGTDAVHRPWHRVYGRKRIELLLEGFESLQSRFLVKEPWGPWREVSRDVALDVPADPVRYGLGEMILKKRGDNERLTHEMNSPLAVDGAKTIR